MDNNVQSIPEEKIVKSSSKGLHLIIALLVVIIVVLIGIFIYLFLSPNKSEAPSSTTKIVPVSHKTSSTLNSYQGWKTYTNPTYGYSFKYPSSWSINTSQAIPSSSIATLDNSVVTLSNNGNVIKFNYHLSGIGGTLLLASLIQRITVSGRNYDLFFQSASSCSEVGSPGSAAAYPRATVPQSCIAEVQSIFLDNVSEVVTSNGNSFGSPFMSINGNNSLSASIGLKLNAPIDTSTINSNQYIKVFKQFLSTVIF